MRRTANLNMFVAIFILFSGLANGQSYNNLDSLQRFAEKAQLGQVSEIDLRTVHAGDNVLETVKRLQQNGGQVQHISGGNRSTKVDVTFSQPYLNSELLQQLRLYFDKELGFINKIELTYTLASRYLDILPIYQKTIEQAVAKYGEPLSFDRVKEITEASSNVVRLSDFIKKLAADEKVLNQVQNYFDEKIVTSKTQFSKDDDGRALLLTGFKQCYFWDRNGFSEILSLCAFQPSSGNMKGQGITLNLINFSIQHAIRDFQQDKSSVDINF